MRRGCEARLQLEAIAHVIKLNMLIFVIANKKYGRSVEYENAIALESSTMAMVGHSEAQVEEDSSSRNAGERMNAKAEESNKDITSDKILSQYRCLRQDRSLTIPGTDRGGNFVKLCTTQ